MDFGLGLIILAEVAAILLLCYGFMHEQAVIAWEDRMIAAVRKKIKAYLKARQRAKRRKLNAAAAYTPVKPDTVSQSRYGAA